mmetsp:Transcript_16469/g.39423  ORF Transcript_16469/g.39423 Transcript_16469/m.39423 type:complete len:496 (+) Transcript_16469:123-1610(+)
MCGLVMTVAALLGTMAVAAVADINFPAMSSRGGSSSRVHNFSFESGIYYELSANDVPGEFCDPNSSSRSGYFGVEGSKWDLDDNKNYFYWFFERRSTSLLPEDEKSDGRDETDEDIPFLVWLNGGPGCSSLLGLLQENGPCLVSKDGISTTINPYSWTEVAHVLYLDQPASTGYSYGDPSDINQDMVAEDAYYFLQSWFQSTEGSKYKDLPLYLTGESYAGHYIPAIANRIWTGNRHHTNKDLLHLPLSGLAIGNGAFDAEEQMKWLPEMAYNNPHGIEVYDKAEYEHYKDAAEDCSRDAHKCNNEGSEIEKGFICQKALHCNEDFFYPLQDKNISIYDITKPCIGPLCTDETPITTFLNLDETKAILGVPSDITWEVCDDHVSTIWSQVDRVTSFAPYVSDILNDGMPVLIYAGDLDFICNYMGNRAVALNLEWDHGEDFRSADDHDWNNGGGLARSSSNLSFLQVYDAGHMAPGDQPKQALQMIRQFLDGEAF